MALNGSKTDFILAVKPSILLQKWPKKRLFNSFLLTKTSDTFRLSLLKLPVSFFGPDKWIVPGSYTRYKAQKRLFLIWLQAAKKGLFPMYVNSYLPNIDITLILTCLT